MILPNLQAKKIILASGSPRRQQLIRALGVDVEVRLKDTDEDFPASLQREQVARYLAEKKADAFHGELAPNEVLITGDTTVYLNGEILNKPLDAQEAFAMLKKLSNQTHTVITAVCIVSDQHKQVFHDETEVTFGALSDDEINYYIQQYKPFDKAGAYGAQDFIGYIGIVDMHGSFYNVMGFPLHLVYRALKELKH